MTTFLHFYCKPNAQEPLATTIHAFFYSEEKQEEIMVEVYAKMYLRRIKETLKSYGVFTTEEVDKYGAMLRRVLCAMDETKEFPAAIVEPDTTTPTTEEPRTDGGIPSLGDSVTK